MTATESLMEGGQATFDKNTEKVDFELQPKNVGLTKEQLESYRNDPFWKPIRTILFIAFWLAWIAMFAAAIAIVVLSPKCAEKQEPHWWQTKVSYQLLTATFYDSDGDGVGDFNGISEKIDLLRKIGITTVYPSPVIATDKDQYFNPYDVVDHENVDPRFGSEESFKNLIEVAHNRDMYVVIDIPISSVSEKHPWFTEGDVEQFVTAAPADPAYRSDKYFDFPGKNGTKYLGFPTKANPVLNWKSDKVRQTIIKSIKKFLSLGVDGIHLDHISQLSIGADGESETDKSISTLKMLTKIIKDHISMTEVLMDKKIVLFSSLRDIEGLHVQAKDTGDLHYVIDSSFAKLQKENCPKVAQCVDEALDKAFERESSSDYTPFWQFSNPWNSRLASRFDTETANLLTFMQLSLPGALSLYYGQELGLQDHPTHRGLMQWSKPGSDHHGFLATGSHEKLFFDENPSDDGDNFDDQFALENSPLKVYRKLAKLRQRDVSLIVGNTKRNTDVSNDLIVFSRAVSTNNTGSGSAFLAVLNFGDVEQNIELKDYATLLPSNKDIARAEIAAVTTGVSSVRSRDKVDFSVNQLVLPPKQGALIKF